MGSITWVSLVIERVGPGASWIDQTDNVDPANLSAGYVIGNTLANASRVWDSKGSYNTLDGGTNYHSHSYSYGNFRGTRGYIGVRFQINGETKYGWIEFEGAGQQTNHQPGIIHDWAYEACTDEPIVAGATTGGADCGTIPTLNEWGMIFLVSLLAAGGLAYGRKEEELS